MNNFTFTKNKDKAWELSYMVGMETVSFAIVPEDVLPHIEAIHTFLTSYLSPEQKVLNDYKAELLKVLEDKGAINKTDIELIKLKVDMEENK